MVDTNPGDGNDNLAQYWKHGPGRIKIVWGVPGDFTRCKAHLERHVGPERAAEYCARWHHDMTGMWPGDKRNK